jgi:acyl-CoA synthetase (NDP forming)
VIRVDSLGELADIAAIAGMQPLPRGPRIAVVGNSGGPAVLATDACVAQGLVVARLSAETTQRLSDLLPASAAVTGPVDVTAGATLAQLREAIELTAADPGVDVVLTVLTVLSHLPVAGLIDAQDQVAGTHPETTFVTCIFGDRLDLHGTVPRLRQPEDAVRAVARLSAYAGRQARDADTASAAAESTRTTMDLAAARDLAHRAVDVGGDCWLPAAEAYRLLEHCGFAIAPFVATDDADAAAEASAFLPYPVVVKADGPELLHKSDQGAVVLGLTGPEEVRAAVHDLERRLGGRMHSVLVQAQVHGGAEIIVGATRDPRFGPLIMLGRGGVSSDVDPDRTWAMAPVRRATAAEMITDLRSAAILRGHRGQPPADLDQLADVITRVSRLMVEVPEISEIDLNPVLARADDAVVVDVRVRVRRAPAPELLDHVRHLR